MAWLLVAAVSSACAPPGLGGSDAPNTAAPIGATGNGAAPQGASRRIEPVVPTATVRPQAAPVPEAGAPLPTPMAAAVTPVLPEPPALPTLTLPPRRELDGASQAAGAAIAATAAVRVANATATALARPAQEVRIQDLAFQPAILTVAPGTTVVWRNADRVMHQVQGGEFDSGHLPAGQAWAMVMNRPGRYAFLCAFHPTMRAEITVSTDDTRPLHSGS